MAITTNMDKNDEIEKKREKIVLDNINKLLEVNEEFWTDVLETDYKGITLPSNIDNCYAGDCLKSIDRTVNKIILEKYGYEHISDVIKEIDLYKKEIFQVIQVIALLKGYSKNLRREATIEYMEVNGLLDSDVIEKDNVTESKRVLTGLFLTNNLSKDILLTYLLVSKYERYSYNEYNMIINDEGIDDEVELAEIKQYEMNGVEINDSLSINDINNFLNEYEEDNDTNLTSRCIKNLIYKNELIIFILREAFRDGARTIDKYIVNTNAEYIVLRLSLDSKELKVRTIISDEEFFITVAKKIVNFFNNMFDIKYVKSNMHNDETKMKKFFEACIRDSISGVFTDEIEVVNSNIEGLPSISIKSNSREISLVKSIDVKGNGALFRLINGSKLEKVKVRYFDNKGTHIFTLKVKQFAEKTYIYISGQGGGVDKKRKLINLYKEKIDVNILEVNE